MVYVLEERKGRVFRMAEAMTRHTSEVDVYHLANTQVLGPGIMCYTGAVDVKRPE